MRLTDRAAKSNFKEKYLSRRRYFRLPDNTFYQNDFFPEWFIIFAAFVSKQRT